MKKDIFKPDETISEKEIKLGTQSVSIPGLNPHRSVQMRSETMKGIAWYQPKARGAIYWSVPLLKIYLAYGVTSDEYRRAVEIRIANLQKVA